MPAAHDAPSAGSMPSGARRRTTRATAIASQSLHCDTSGNPAARKSRCTGSCSAIRELAKLLGDYAWCLAGRHATGTRPSSCGCFWEMPVEAWPFGIVISKRTVESTRSFGGMTDAHFFDEEAGHLRVRAQSDASRLAQSGERGNQVWGRRGVAIAQNERLPVTRSTAATTSTQTSLSSSPNDGADLLCRSGLIAAQPSSSLR